MKLLVENIFFDIFWALAFRFFVDLSKAYVVVVTNIQKSLALNVDNFYFFLHATVLKHFRELLLNFRQNFFLIYLFSSF